MALRHWSLDRICAWAGVGSLLALFLPVALYVTHAVTSAADESLRHSGQTLGRALAGEAVEPLLLDDRLALRSIVERAARMEGLEYLCVEDRHGSIVACTQVRGCPEYLGQVQASLVGGERISNFRVGPERLMNVSVPVLEGHVGQIHVGLSRTSAVRAGDRALWLMGLPLIAALSILLVASRLVADLVGRPLSRLEQEISHLPACGQAGAFDVHGTREVNALARGVASMVDRLVDLDRQQQAAQERMVHAERLAVLGELAAGLAHEIHNPLDGMLECLRYLDADPHRSERAEKYYPLLQEGLERIARTMRQMLSFARSGQQLSSQPCLIRALFDEMRMMIQPRLAGSRVRLSMHSDGVCYCLCDRDGLSQVMLNLVLNAAEAAEAGEDPEVRVHSTCDREWVYLRVDDSGEGVGEALRAKVFDAFFTTKPTGKGTGLGLSVSRQIARAIGGDIELSDDPSPLGGARFVVRLPKVTSQDPDHDCTCEHPYCR